MNIIKYLQAQGIDTRKGCQWLVKHGLVHINGETVPDDKADIAPDSVQTLTIDGEDAVVIPLPYFPPVTKPRTNRATIPACFRCCPTKCALPTFKPSDVWTRTPPACCSSPTTANSTTA